MTSVSTGKSFFEVTISSGQTVSGAATLGDHVLCGFITPSALTGSSMTFQGSVDGTNYYTIYDYTNALISTTVDTSSSRAYALNVIDFLPWRYIKIVSASAEGSDRDIQLLATRALNSR